MYAQDKVCTKKLLDIKLLKEPTTNSLSLLLGSASWSENELGELVIL